MIESVAFISAFEMDSANQDIRDLDLDSRLLISNQLSMNIFNNDLIELWFP